MPARHHLSSDLKAALRRQTILPHGFQRDQALTDTRASIENAIEVLSRHRPSSWHLILVGAFTGFNFGRGVQCLWRYIEDTYPNDEARRVQMGAQMREGIVKCIPFIGIPRVLSSIENLQTAQGREMGVLIGNVLRPLRTGMLDASSSMMQNGETLWNDVYSPSSLSIKLRNKIAGFHPNLADLIISSSYGHAMSPVSVVSREDTSAIAVTVLRVEEDVLDQLTSHVYGLLKGGGDQAYVKAIIDVVDGLRSGNMASVKSQL